MSPVIVHATFLLFGLISFVFVFKDTGEAPRLFERAEKQARCWTARVAGRGFGPGLL